MRATTRPKVTGAIGEPAISRGDIGPISHRAFTEPRAVCSKRNVLTAVRGARCLLGRCDSGLRAPIFQMNENPMETNMGTHDLFVRATKLYQRKCKREGLVFQQPSGFRVDRKEGKWPITSRPSPLAPPGLNGGSITLENVHGDLITYGWSAAGRLAEVKK